jgi:hypothetical protein
LRGPDFKGAKERRNDGTLAAGNIDDGVATDRADKIGRDGRGERSATSSNRLRWKQ